jgi:ferredoxin-type protein NapH
MNVTLVETILALILSIGLAVAGVLVILIWKRDRTRRLSYLRLFIQVTSLVALFYSFTMSLWLVYFLVVIIAITFLSGRLFCGWICPFGLYMDAIALLRKKLGVRYRTLSDRVNALLHKVRWVIAAILLVSPFIFGLFPIGPAWGVQLNWLSGPWRPLGVFLSPLEPLIVPFTEIIANLGFLPWSVSYPYARDIMFYINIPNVSMYIIYAFIALTLTATFMFRRFWCRFCPTGISLAVVNRFRGLRWMPLLHINKVEEKCTKCGICKRVCPVQVTEVYDKKGGNIKTSMCLNCFRCVEMCPYEGCLKVNLASKTMFKSRNWLEPSINE